MIVINKGVCMSKVYGFFVKFSNNIDHLKAIQNGKLFMNNGKYFIDLECDSNIQGIGDKNEFNNVMYNVKYSILESGSDEILADGISPRFTTRLDKYLYSPLFCLSFFFLNKTSYIIDTIIISIIMLFMLFVSKGCIAF